MQSRDLVYGAGVLLFRLGVFLLTHSIALGRKPHRFVAALPRVETKIVFGHGHPMTSGSPGIDYFVSSDLFETTASIDARELRRIAGTASDLSLATTVTNDAGAEGCDDDDSVHSPTARDTCQADTLRSGDGQPHHYENLPRSRTHQTLAEEKRNTTQNLEPWRGRGGEGEQDYAEQLVLFDSLTASLSEVFGPENAPSSAVAAVVAAAAPSRPRAEMSLEEGDHLYHCIQHSKKFHPDFDQVMRGVLQRDPAAKILLTAGSEVTSCFIRTWRVVFSKPLFSTKVSPHYSKGIGVCVYTFLTQKGYAMVSRIVNLFAHSFCSILPGHPIRVNSFSAGKGDTSTLILSFA